MATSNSYSPSTGTVLVNFISYPVAVVNINSGDDVCINTTTGFATTNANTAGLVFLGQANNDALNSTGTVGLINVNVTMASAGPYQNFQATSPVAQGVTNTWVGSRVFSSGPNAVTLVASNTNVCVGTVVNVVNTGASTGIVTVDLSRRFVPATS